MANWVSVRNDYITATPQLDDLTTQTNLRFLMELDDQISETWLTEAIERGIAFLLRSQYPIGCWPHEYTSESSWSILSKASQLKMNDGATTETMRVLIMAHDRYGGDDIKDALERAAQFLVDAQLFGDPGFAGSWAQQYDQNAGQNSSNHKYEPTTTRNFEHPSASTVASYDAYLALCRFCAWKGGNGESGDFIVTSALSAVANGLLFFQNVEVATENWPPYHAYFDSTSYQSYLSGLDAGGGVVGPAFNEGDAVYFDRAFRVYSDFATYDAIASNLKVSGGQYVSQNIQALIDTFLSNPPHTNPDEDLWSSERPLINNASRPFDSGTFNPEEAISNQNEDGIWEVTNDSKNYFGSEIWRTYMLRLNDFLGVDDAYSSFSGANDYSADSTRMSQSAQVNTAIDNAISGLSIYKTTGGWPGYQNVADSTDRFNESFSDSIDDGFISTKEIGTALVGSELVIAYRLFDKATALAAAREAGWALACTQTYIGGWPYESKLDDYVASYNANEVPAKVFNNFRSNF